LIETPRGRGFEGAITVLGEGPRPRLRPGRAHLLEV